jgi:hypothetical protein
MKFQIFGDKQKIKEFLDEFINLAEEEYEIQMKKTRNMPMPFGLSVPDLPLQMGYIEEADSIIFYNTFQFPKVLRLIRGRIVKKMEENLKGFFKAKEIEVEIKYLGD